MSQIEELIKPFRKKVDELLTEQKAYLAEFGGLMTSLVEKGDKVAAITQEILNTKQTIREGRLKDTEARQKNHPKAEAARAIISNKELSDMEVLIPVHIRTRGDISSRARRLHTLFVTEIIPKMNALADEVRGISVLDDNYSMQDFKQQLRKTRENLHYIARE
jgi:hypothetical protein